MLIVLVRKVVVIINVNLVLIVLDFFVLLILIVEIGKVVVLENVNNCMKIVMI